MQKLEKGANLCQQLEKVRYCSEDCTTSKKRRNNCTISLGFTSQAVASSTKVHRICATGHGHAVDAPQWSEIYVNKISGSKHTDGNKAWNFPFSHVR